MLLHLHSEQTEWPILNYIITLMFADPFIYIRTDLTESTQHSEWWEFYRVGGGGLSQQCQQRYCWSRYMAQERPQFSMTKHNMSVSHLVNV